MLCTTATNTSNTIRTQTGAAERRPVRVREREEWIHTGDVERERALLGDVIQAQQARVDDAVVLTTG